MKRIQTRVFSDLTKYTENFFFGMSLRQTIFSLAGVAATALTYILLRFPGIFAMACGIPFFALAFLRPDGLFVEVWLCHWVRSNILRPRVRENMQGSELYAFLFEGRLLTKTVLTGRELRKIRKECEHEKKTEGGVLAQEPRD